MKQRILIVDDEPAIRYILKSYLDATFDVVLKASGKEALHWLEQGNLADAIVLDHHLPELDGPFLIQAIRALSSCREVVLFVLSTSDQSSSRIHCLRLGADDFLLKPFNPEELVLRLSNWLTRLKSVV